jgi:hypothetical protein
MDRWTDRQIDYRKKWNEWVPSSKMWRRTVFKMFDGVSGEYTASIFRTKTIHWVRKQVDVKQEYMLAACLTYSTPSNIEAAACSSWTWMNFCRNSRCHIPTNFTLHSHHNEDLTPHMKNSYGSYGHFYYIQNHLSFNKVIPSARDVRDKMSSPT